MTSTNPVNPENVESGSEEKEHNYDNVGNLHVLPTNSNSKLSNSKQPRTQFLTSSFVKKMIILIRELCFLMLLIVTYATFHNK